eukprot:gene9201-biopygen6424
MNAARTARTHGQTLGAHAQTHAWTHGELLLPPTTFEKSGISDRGQPQLLQNGNNKGIFAGSSSGAAAKPAAKMPVAAKLAAKLPVAAKPMAKLVVAVDPTAAELNLNWSTTVQFSPFSQSVRDGKVLCR